MNGVATLVADLRAAGVRPDRPLLVHTSLRSLGPLPCGLSGLMEALREAVADSTLLVPALSYDLVDWSDPVFSVREAATCIGAFPEFARKLGDARRSYHLTHSVCAFGIDADAFVCDHHLDDTPGGPRSPFRRLVERGGSILMLGCGLRPNTTMHSVEEIVEPPYLFAPGITRYRIVVDEGAVLHASTRRHGFRDVVQRYDRIGELLSYPELRRSTVGSATTYLIDAAAMAEMAVEAMRTDPFFFVDRDTIGEPDHVEATPEPWSVPTTPVCPTACESGRHREPGSGAG